jgi:hypothetical protein
MASNFNSLFNYKTQVEGETPWEKIKTINGFIEGRKRAVALEKVQEIRTRAMNAKLEFLKEHGPLHEALELEAEIMERDSSKDDAEHAFKLAHKELEILYAYREELYAEAEPTRIEGKSDDEMFELNAENEFATWVLREIQAEIVAYGRPSPAKLRNAMSSQLATQAMIDLKIVPPEFKVLTGHNDIKILISGTEKSFLLENGE